MDKKQFNDMVAEPSRFSSQDRGWLKAMMAKYPHSPVVGVMALLADHAFGFDTPEQRRSVALAVCDFGRVEHLLSSVAVADVRPDDASFDVLSEINTYQEVSFKTAPKSVILSNFLQVDPSEEGGGRLSQPVAEHYDDKKSLVSDLSFGTETLAVVFEKQGRYDKALAIYENLLAHNPEKSSNFAPRIERLKSLLNNK